MAVTGIADVQDQVQKFWAPMFMKELRESMILGSLVNRDYQGDLQKQGDTVKVSVINAPTGQLLTVGTDADSFEAQQLDMTKVEVKADKRAVAAYEFDDLSILQSQLESQDSEIRESLMFAVSEQINNYLYSLALAPTVVQTISGTYDSADLSTTRKSAATAKWQRDKGWFGLYDPGYYSDLINDTTIASSDFGAGDAPTISGQLAMKRYGFNILEDNSDGLLQLAKSGETSDAGIAFHPDFLLMVMQTLPNFQISSLHGQKKFGFVMSVDTVFGAAIGPDGAAKHIRINNA